MATYTRPGVYVEEHLNPIADLPSAPGESIAAFVGVSTGGGPVGPTLISSFSQYQALFGSLAKTNDDLGYAVFTYFANGGTPCYVVRALNADATAASLTIQDTENTPANTLRVTASAPGTWASDPNSSSRIFITVTPKSAGRFDLTVEVGSGFNMAARENFSDLTMNPQDGRNAINIVNSPVVGSKFVTLTALYSGSYADNKNPAAVNKSPLTGGTDGTGSPDVGAAVSAGLDSLDSDLVINLPGAAADDVSTAVAWAESTGRHFVVADVLKPAQGETADESVTAMTNYQSALSSTSSYVAIYGPWVYIVDPASKGGALRLTAPGGAVVGQFLRTDALRGVQKAPAGTQTALGSFVNGPYEKYTPTQEDSIYGAQINLIKQIPGAGICIWGARTQALGVPDRAVPIRRTLIAVEATLTAITRFAVFEDNGPDLWATITDVCENYLGGLLSVGTLKGNTSAQAFYVTCDDTNNSPESVAAGEVHIEVGIALQTPAEFIVIRLGQTASGTTANDSLEA